MASSRAYNVGVSRLTWVERDHGWRAGPYEIELAAPELWVCTRRLRHGLVKVELTSGSLTALKGSIENRDSRRRKLHQALRYLATFIVAMAVVAMAAAAGWPLTPWLVLIFSVTGLIAAFKALDCILERSWESLRLHYQ